MKTHPIWHRPGRRPSEIRKILSDPAHPEFATTAAHLLSAVGDPEDIAKWIDLDLLARAYGPRIRNRISPRSARENADLLVKILRRKTGPPPRSVARQDPRDPEMAALGRRLRAFRKEMGLTAEEIARRRGISRPWITRIESGRSQISVRTMIDYVEAAGGAVRIEIQPVRGRRPLSRRK